MKKFVLFVILSIVLFTWSAPSWSQTLFVENFDYPAGNNLTDHGWTQFESGADFVTVAATGLSYTGYPSSGVGNAALLDAAGQAVTKSFPQQTSGSFYVSFLVNVADAITVATNFAYPLGLGRNGNSGVWARFWVVKNSSTSALKFGLAQFTETETFTNFDYALNTTYLIVIKYTIVAGANNDQASLFVFSDPTLPATEPQTPTIGPLTSGGLDPDFPDIVILRQRDAANNIRIDGIQMGLTWGDGAPLPVELASFNYSVTGREVHLKWATATETDNFGFEIERKFGKEAWRKSGFVQGAGTTLQPQLYTFVDRELAPGDYQYRLKQIDTDGKFDYSQTLNVTVGGPVTQRLAQNYPNPFNPTTNISYAIEEDGFVQLNIHNVLGHLVRSLVAENQVAGEYAFAWDGRDDAGASVAGGTYFYALKVGDKIIARKKMILLK